MLSNISISKPKKSMKDLQTEIYSCISIYTSIFQRVMLEYVVILRDVVPAPLSSNQHPMEVPGRVPLKMSIDQQLLGLLPASTFKPHTP